LLRAVDPLDEHRTWTWVTHMRGAVLAPVMAQWKADGAVAVVLDNAPGHRKAVPRAATPPLVLLPHSSPELEGEAYATATRERAERVLDANPDCLRTLTMWPWLVEQVTAARVSLAPSGLHERL
jgi:hypothetical protein